MRTATWGPPASEVSQAPGGGGRPLAPQPRHGENPPFLPTAELSGQASWRECGGPRGYARCLRGRDTAPDLRAGFCCPRGPGRTVQCSGAPTSPPPALPCVCEPMHTWAPVCVLSPVCVHTGARRLPHQPRATGGWGVGRDSVLASWSPQPPGEHASASRTRGAPGAPGQLAQAAEGRGDVCWEGGIQARGDGLCRQGKPAASGEWGTPSAGWMLYMRVFEPGSPAWLLGALGWVSRRPVVEASRLGSGCGQSVPTAAPGGQLWYCMAGPVPSWLPGHVAGVWALVVTLQASGKEERQGCAALQSWALPPALEWTGRLLVEPPPCCWAGGTGSFLWGGRSPAVGAGVSRARASLGRTLQAWVRERPLHVGYHWPVTSRRRPEDG